MGTILMSQHCFKDRTNNAFAVRSFTFKNHESLAGSVRRQAKPEPFLQDGNSFGVSFQVAVEEGSPAWAVSFWVEWIWQARFGKPSWSMRQQNFGPAGKEGVQVQQPVA